MKRIEGRLQNGRVLNIVVGAFAAIILSILPISMMVDASEQAMGGVVILTRTANLVSPTGSVNPHGDATYEVYNSGQREIEIETEDVNAANGTILSFFVDGNLAGQISLFDQKAKLKLKTELGQVVPTVNGGSTVQVRNGATIILNGVFNGANPTPSPSVSPTVSPSPTTSPSPNGSPSPSPLPIGGDLFAALTGATINGALPNGFAQYEFHSNRTELEIRVRQVNLPIGTTLAVSVNNISVAQLVLESGGEGRLRLRSDNGQTVPVATAGSTIAVKNGNTTVLSGTFGGEATPNPSPSPSANPTPTQGKSFEAHLSGSLMNPPVSTNATGEVKVLLNQNENLATVTGEFHNLSSAQTGAKIEILVGTTSGTFSFTTTGGTNGKFLTSTFPVTSAQVAQLRTGLWSAVVVSVNNPNGEIRGQLTTHSNSSDFDGDGRNDVAVFRPSAGTWFTQNSQGFGAQTFGSATDKLVSGDFDGDGRTDAAVFQNINGAGIWSINRSSDGGTTFAQFGLVSDTPVRGDFDGDGRSDLAVYRSSTGTWYIQRSNNSGFVGVQFGASEDIPVATDLDGDGKADIAVFRPSNGVWYWLSSSNDRFSAVQFGQNGDVPIAGDFDGDGKADLSVFRPSNGVWYIQRSSDGTYDFRQFGLGTDVPVAGNYDGDNKTDIAVFRPSNGIWYIWRSIDGAVDYRQFGQNGDIPTVSR